MSYFDLKSSIIENDHYLLEYLEDAGPRIVRLVHKASGVNLLAELPELALDSPLGPYRVFGGHRFWVAPETWDTCYHPDNHGVSISQAGGRIVLGRDGEPPLHLYKQMTIQMDQNESSIKISHFLRNDSQKPFSCAPWGITMLTPGGTAISPLRKDFNGSAGLTPDRALMLWPYTRINDPRLYIQDDVAYIKAENGESPLKIGARMPSGWLAYLHQGVCLYKKAGFNTAAQYPDFGCNLEVYTNGVFIELETLGELKTLKPGESTLHIEEWQMFSFSGSPEELFQKMR